MGDSLQRAPDACTITLKGVDVYDPTAGIWKNSLFAQLFAFLYAFSILGLSLFGLQSLALTGLFLFHRRRAVVTQSLPALQRWPTVTVQLPIYNERHVVRRLIDAVCALDYPADRLSIQVLDDSTDDTTALIGERIAHHRARGVDIRLLHRDQRAGYKAGALAAAFPRVTSEFIAILDADFVPPPDFLRRLLPYFFTDPHIGMVQARWGHLNAGAEVLTRAQALALDGHFFVEQVGRSRSGLPFNFNGAAGVLRRACIADAGGWHADTLSEDLDLSYRAQIKGWRLAYAAEVIVPAEIPPQIAGFKRQQFRWARGCIQNLRKQFIPLWTTPHLSFFQRLGGTLHLSAYLVYPLMLLALLSALPVVLTRAVVTLPWAIPWLAGFGPLLLYPVSQWAAYRDWLRRIVFFPALICLGVGVTLNNTWAVVGALLGVHSEFARTPKFGLAEHWQTSDYALGLDWSVWGELALAAFSGVTLALAFYYRAPGLAPFLIILTCSFAYVGLLGVWQARRRTASVRPQPAKMEDAGPLAPEVIYAGGQEPPFLMD